MPKSKKKLCRVYHPISMWEEIGFNMWGDVEDRKDALQKAIEFTSNHTEYGRFMKRVAVEWSFSCENALTDSFLNRKAWIGHAACALALRVPENIVREAWGSLTDEQRFLANREAERAISAWEKRYVENTRIHT